MRALLAALLALSWLAASAGDKHPGYGVVEAVAPVKAAPSATAGASAPSQAKGKYRLRVRLDDGTIQYRTVDKREFSAGDRVLLTNAGDVVPE